MLDDEACQTRNAHTMPHFLSITALWVMWGLLCGHLVAFKAPKSWPNKFLINVWGGFSVIFIASYTANIAALIAGLLFHNEAKYYEMSVSTWCGPTMALQRTILCDLHL